MFGTSAVFVCLVCLARQVYILMRWNCILPLREEPLVVTGGTLVLRESSILSLAWRLSTLTVMVFGLDVVHRVYPVTPLGVA